MILKAWTMLKKMQILIWKCKYKGNFTPGIDISGDDGDDEDGNDGNLSCGVSLEIDY